MRFVFLSALAVLLAACTATPQPVEPVNLSYLRADEPPSEALRGLAEASRGSYLQARIFMPNWQSAGGGGGLVNGASATLVDGQGLAVTVAHIAMGVSYDAAVIKADGQRYRARILDVSPQQELALLQFEPSGDMTAATPPAFAPPESLSPGDQVFAIGTPGNRAGVVAQGRVVQPRSARRISYGEYGYDNAIVLAMDAVPGFSGGPLFDMKGRLVGIIASFDLESRPSRHIAAGRAYAIPIRDIQFYLKSVDKI